MPSDAGFRTLSHTEPDEKSLIMNHILADDIICAPATIPGTGAISVIRLSGAGCLELADRVIRLKKGKLAEAAGYTLHYGVVHKSARGDKADAETTHTKSLTGDILDDVIVSVFRAPHSYTGEDSIEISCHASRFIVSELLRLLVKNGCRLAGPGEFTRRAFLNGKMDLAQAEAVADVIASSSEAGHRVAMSQMRGGVSKELAAMRSKLLELVTLMELELDFSEEDVEFADRTRLKALVDRTAGHIRELKDSFRLGNALRNGVPVAIVGATNAGKSTLLNTLLGEERAIVSDIDGTTRDTVEETLNIDGVLFRFIDTAGLRESADAIERIGIERSYRKLSEASVVLAMLDATKPETAIAESLTRLLPLIDFSAQKLFVLLNKIDGISREELDNKNVSIENIIVSLFEDPVIAATVADSALQKPLPKEIKLLPISAKTGEGISELKTALADSQKDLLGDSSDRVLVTNFRHYEALSAALASLSLVRSGLDSGTPADLLSEDLREAISALGSITGEITSQEVLENVFRNFCVGK